MRIIVRGAGYTGAMLARRKRSAGPDLRTETPVERAGSYREARVVAEYRLSVGAVRNAVDLVNEGLRGD
ncbi:hypothetical protein [Halalkalicoccus subterraneus]|uniref:hypothetical protein n=1 Tax=Halalkalicoccus subterraneus TaxID=2675002 RepID=UPI000EFC1894|nr:hypothetical protein [Halalkalicoccus subterraneus]